MEQQDIIYQENSSFSPNPSALFTSGVLAEFKKMVDDSPHPAILCTTIKADNPNYLAIIHANQAFCNNFDTNAQDLLGRSYDFLFDDIDINYTTEDQMEYIRLVKAIKDRLSCSIVMNLDYKHEGITSTSRFNINFKPLFDNKDIKHAKFYGFISLEKLTSEVVETEGSRTQNQALVKNLERALHSERLLREISYLIISDKPVKEIAQTIAKSLCLHLKVDRCIVHDWRNSEMTFVVEHASFNAKPILTEDNKKNIESVAPYIKFQHNFYEKIKANSKNSAIFIVDNVKEDPSFEVLKPFYENFSVASQVTAITSFDDEMNGGIYIHQSQKRSWTIDEIELLEMITDQLAIAFDRSYSIEKVMIANHNLLEKTLELKEAVKKEKALRKIQSEFVALVSHEFKTPLQIIDSTRELLSRKIKNLPNKDESLDKYLDRIKSGIARMSSLITSTLNLAKIETGSASIKVEKQIFDLNHLITDIIERNKNLATNKGIKIITKIAHGEMPLNGDQKLLDHCFTNIITNAIKYSKDNGVVDIITKMTDSKVAVRVIDSGIGIPESDLQNIGKKFYRAQNTLAVAGTGIGLYLTKYFVELHKGDVLIRSKLNIGTSVTIVLPRL